MPATRALGIVAAGAMLVSYGLQRRSHWFTFAFALACALAAVYAFLIGAWIFGVLELAWYLVAMRRWTDRQVYE